MRISQVETIPGVAQTAAEIFTTALAVRDGEKTYSFQALFDAALNAGAAFIAAGLQKGDRVCLWAPNSVDWIIACLGAQIAGGVIVPLNTRLKGREAQFILNKSRVRFLITVDTFLGQNYPAQLENLDLPHLEKIIRFEQDWAGFLATATDQTRVEAKTRLANLKGSDPSDIIFTSGTTGEPKGVVLAHHQTVTVFQTWSDRIGLRRGDRYLIVNPFFHVFGYKAGWFACLLTGATAYPLSSLNVPDLLALVKSEKITVLPGPPAIFQTLLASDIDRADLASLRLAVTGAASIAPILIERMRKDLGIATVLTGYGLTESTGVVSLSDAHDPAEIVATRCGKAIPGIEVRIADDQGQTLPAEQEGEILVRGPNVMQGYFEDPEATAKAIDSDGWLHTGDVGCFDANGYLRITDRLKDMYITGGFNCYPAEIERIIERHPHVAQAAVIGVADERMGEVGKAFVVARAGAALNSEDLLIWCKAEMANYKAPRFISIVDKLPLNASGKVQKFALPS